jgi:hypothetical protein
MTLDSICKYHFVRIEKVSERRKLIIANKYKLENAGNIDIYFIGKSNLDELTQIEFTEDINKLKGSVLKEFRYPRYVVMPEN